MPIIPLYGHAQLRGRLRRSVERGTLPASLLIQGPRGVGKQRLALWLGQMILCTAADPSARPCGECRSCRYVLDLCHPDLRWFFPRPRPKEADLEATDVLDDAVDAMSERLTAHGLYPPASGSEGIFVSTVRAIVRLAAMTPTFGARKVFVIGDADRMVSQTGSDQAANAFLKLLEEPPADTTFILTSSEPGALLPTIRSRVITLRATSLRDVDMRAFLADATVREALKSSSLPASIEERLRIASGAPGLLLAGGSAAEALVTARALLAAARGRSPDRHRLTLGLGSSRARGQFSEVLDALTIVLRDVVRESVEREDSRRAAAAARGIGAVERAKMHAAGNVNPQLVGAALVRELSESGA